MIRLTREYGKVWNDLQLCLRVMNKRPRVAGRNSWLRPNR